VRGTGWAEMASPGGDPMGTRMSMDRLYIDKYV
jgi:hypothetical protein